jgi:hypothetical protein
MIKLMKLRGQVRLNMDRTFDYLGELYDGTQFEVRVDIHDFELNDDFTPDNYQVDGWLYVVQEAQQGDRCALTLPKPHITFGKQVTANELQLMPRVSSIADFRPQVSGGKVKSAKVEHGKVVEVPTDAVAAAEVGKMLGELAHKPEPI